MRLISRERKFWLIKTFLLPVGLLVLKVLSRSYRLDPSISEVGRDVVLRNRPMVLATYHGQSPALIPLARIAQKEERNVCAMTSPSQDGQIMDAVLESVGMRVVKGSSRSKAASGALAMIDAVKEGNIGLLSVDGPRGPIGVPKPGIFAIAEATGAEIICVTAAASRFITFGSWDALFLPLPFAKITYKVSEFVVNEGESREDACGRLAKRLYEDAASINSSTVRKIPSEVAS